MLGLFVTVATIGIATAQTPNAPMTNGVGAADSTNSKSAPTLQTWMSDYSTAHKGYISRKAYMDEMGRRWDAADRSNRGLTVDEINSTYGYTQPNPGMTHGQTNATNPSGTEPKGQNSGGK
jgi:hypothetical protein